VPGGGWSGSGQGFSRHLSGVSLSAICGFWRLNGDADAVRVCAVMLDSLAGHGPDRSSSQICDITAGTREGRIALGHRLLRITAEDALEAQPLADPSLQDHANHDAAVWLAADARLDNRAQLAGELGIAARELAGMADSAVLLRAWQQWGEQCLQRLVGSFAFAVWDPRAERFFLARDHAGDRPLYFVNTAEFFGFATTARALRRIPGVSSELDEGTLLRDLVGLPPEYPRTRFRELQEIAPGHCVVAEREGVTHRRYWRIDALKPVRFARDAEYAEAFLEVFDEAVRCRLRTTGGVAAELSAGLDSGSVAATAARLLAERGGTLDAYTAVPCPGFSGIVPRGLIGDEGAYAAEVAAMYANMRHARVGATGSDMLRELARIYPLLDLPHAAALNSVWSHLIYDHARASGVKVILNGALGNFAFSYAGGDELHGLFRSGRWIRMAQRAWALRRAGVSSGRNAASQTIFTMLPWALRRQVDPLMRDVDVSWSAISPSAAREFDAAEHFRRHLFTRRTRLPHLMETQFQLNQYGDYNAAVGAGWGIETRDPTADRRVFEFCAAIPQEQFVADGRGRSLVRRAMRGRLPDATLDRREKGTQAADWYECLGAIHGELLAELALEEKSGVAARLIDFERLRAALEDWPKTAQEAAERADVYQSAIPRGMAVGYFVRRVEEERATADLRR
jgi:asparagine synthase (glutamine-hydrolysing)